MTTSRIVRSLYQHVFRLVLQGGVSRELCALDRCDTKHRSVCKPTAKNLVTWSSTLQSLVITEVTATDNRVMRAS